MLEKVSYRKIILIALFTWFGSLHAFSQIALPDVKLLSLMRFDQNAGELVDETARVLKENNIVLHHHDRYIRLRVATTPDAGALFYRIDGFDPIWYELNQDPIRTGTLDEGRYRLVIAMKKPEAGMVTIKAFNVQVRAPFFHGLRGQIATFVTVVLFIFFFFSGRSWVLRRDKRRTVKLLENTVQKRTVQLQESVSQRELLLKEIHHRVKNNLQVISALLEMQVSRTDDENVRAAIREGQNRVLSIAFIHENLYQHDDLKGVEVGSFLKELISHIRQVFERPECPVNITNLVPEIFIDIESATPLGLILNELLTNSYKYAFDGRNEGNIRIEIKDLGEGKFYFNYRDDGSGLPANFDFNRSNSLGLKLIRQLSRQLAGNIVYRFDGGSVFELTFHNLDARSKMI